MAADAEIASPTKLKDCKGELNRLMMESQSGGELLEKLAEIAARLERRRCNHADQTGFAEFADDVERELGPLRGNA